MGLWFLGRVNPKNMSKHKDTSWDKVANWYDEVLKDGDSYQQKVILPNLLRRMASVSGGKILDLGCGQGHFARAVRSSLGAKVTGVDLSNELIKIAKQKSPTEIKYHVASADKLPFEAGKVFDAVLSVLSLQNMKDLDSVFREVGKVLKSEGRFFIALNHPCFRIPKQSAWGFDNEAGAQYRRIDSYLSESSERIKLHPGKEDRTATTTFHKPLQVYFKFLAKNGFAVTGFEEWISHKKSQSGPRAKAENKARKEIPMFLFLEARKF